MKKNLAQNAAFNVLYRVLNVIFPLISATYIARVLSPEGVGKVAYAQNIVSYFLMFAALGIPSYGTREVAQNRNDPRALSKLFSELFVINFASTALCIAAYGLFVCAAIHTDGLLYMVFSLDLFFNFINIDWLYQGEEEYVYITLRSILVKVLSLAAMFLLVKDQQDYAVYVLILCLGVGCNNFFNLYHARKKVKLTLRGLELRRHMKPILFLMLSSAAASLYSKVDITMLGMLTSEENVAYYSNAHKIINIVLTLVTALSAVFLPRLSYVYKNDRKQYGQYLSIGLKVVLALAVPSCVGVMIVADNLVLTLFGEAFAPAAATLKILAVFTVIKGAGDLLCYQSIISSGNERQLIRSRVVAGAANIVLNAFLIPRYGHNGAAVASVFSEVIVNGMLLPHSLAIAKPSVGRRFFLSVAAGTLLMAVTTAGVQQALGEGLLPLAGTVAAGVAVYLLVLLVSGNDLMEVLLQKARK